MTSRQQEEALFPAILASTVHDIKNSLGTLLSLIQQMARNQIANQAEDIQQLEFEANRINHSLMQLLVMYKIDCKKFSLLVEEFAAIDLINEAIAQQDRLSHLNGVEVRVECSDELLCYCDCQQVSNALGTILNNAQRYANQTVLISAAEHEGYIKFCIEDDGQGYPEHLLNADFASPAHLDWVSGNTGLGLYFVAAMANFHQNRNKSGFIKIDNQSRFGGARFCLFLP